MFGRVNNVQKRTTQETKNVRIRKSRVYFTQKYKYININICNAREEERITDSEERVTESRFLFGSSSNSDNS